MSNPGAVLYTQSFGTRPEGVEVPFIASRNPVASDVNFPVGKMWINKADNGVFVLTSFTTSNGITSSNWEGMSEGTGDFSTLDVSGQSTLADTDIEGDVNINTSGSADTEIGTGGTGVVNIGNTTGNTTVTGTLTTSDKITISNGGLTVSSDGVDVTGNSTLTGNIDVTGVIDVTGDISSTTDITAGTSLTVTAGDITATDGNFVLGAAGNKLVIATGSNASAGISDSMTAGAVTVATTACSATALVFYARATVGDTPGEVSITAQDATGFTLTSSSATETSTFNWWIINN